MTPSPPPSIHKPTIGSPWKKRLFSQKLRCVFVWRRYILLLFLAANLHFWQGELFTCPKTFWHLFPQEGRTTTKWNYFLNYSKRSPRKAFNFDKYWRLVIPRTSCHLNIQEKEIFKERTSVSYFLLLISRRILKYKRGCFSFTLFDRSLVPIFWQQSPDWI